MCFVQNKFDDNLAGARQTDRCSLYYALILCRKTCLLIPVPFVMEICHQYTLCLKKASTFKRYSLKF